MLLRPTELRDVHAAFGSPESLVERRRAMYSAIVELAGGRRGAEADSDLLDSPVARGHLGEVVVDVRLYRPDAAVPLSRLTAGAAEFRGETSRTFVVADRHVGDALDPAVRHIASQLGHHGVEGSGIGLMLEGDPRFDDASRAVVEGLELAVKLCPELAEDVLPHVALFALIATDGTDQLGSASAREYPGLVLLPRPASAVEVAEALVHEGAHQKFFDLATVRSVFGPDFVNAPLFKASWSAPSAPAWPLEQCVAAFHAYTCLATFNEGVRESSLVSSLHRFSLLPEAATRAAELQAWVWTNQSFLGPDGRTLVAGLSGHVEPVMAASNAGILLDAEAPTVVRRCGEWSLIAQLVEHITLFWVPTDRLSALMGRSTSHVDDLQ